MTTMTFRMRCIITAMLVLVGTSAMAEDYFPLTVGNTWTYVNLSGNYEVKEVSGTEMRNGLEVWVMTYPQSLYNHNLKQYYSKGEDGTILMHGYSRPNRDVYYDPPNVIFDPSVPVGGSWTQDLYGYDVETGELVVESQVTYQVFEVGEHEVPAGVFPFMGIGRINQSSRGARDEDYTLTGEVKDFEYFGIEYWYTASVGLTRYSPDGYRFDLSSYQVKLVGTESSTLGAVKAFYR